MFFPDRRPGYREARRVLKPGGYFLFNVWDRIEENVFADDVTNALAEFFPSDPPRFLARTPHGYHDTALIRSDLAKAGFTDVAIETRAAQSRAASPRHAALAYCQGTPAAQRDRSRGAQRQAGSRNRPRRIRHREPARQRRSIGQDPGPRHPGPGYRTVLAGRDHIVGRISARTGRRPSLVAISTICDSVAGYHRAATVG